MWSGHPSKKRAHQTRLVLGRIADLSKRMCRFYIYVHLVAKAY